MAKHKDWYFHAQTSDKTIATAIRKLAQSFTRTHRDYIRFYEDKHGNPVDVGYFYDERPSVGFLAAAA